MECLPIYMAAFEQLHERKIGELVDSRLDRRQPSAAEATYLLDVGKMIKEFYVDAPVDLPLPRAQKNVITRQKPRKRRELSAAEKSGSMQSWADVRSTHREGALYNGYMAKFGNVANQSVACVISWEEEWNCPTCKTEMYFETACAAQVCTKCGLSRQHMENTVANLTYDQEMSMGTTCNSPYERMNHLNEILAQVQGKETTSVPERILDAVRAEFKKDGVVKARQVTPEAVRRYLKKLGESAWVSFTLLWMPRKIPGKFDI